MRRAVSDSTMRRNRGDVRLKSYKRAALASQHLDDQRQAALENVPLSELEKRMMYFVENDPSSCENPLQLNDDFEAQYDTPEYEDKIGELLHHAYKRLESEEPEKAPCWDDAMHTLGEGDHHLPVLWDLTVSVYERRSR